MVEREYQIQGRSTSYIYLKTVWLRRWKSCEKALTCFNAGRFGDDVQSFLRTILRTII